MNATLAGWSILGIASAVAILGGIVLLVIYALQRGLVHRELDGTDAADGAAGAETRRVPREPRGRTLGLAGALVLAVGLGLGVLSAMSGWGDPATGAAPGGQPEDCAQSWSGCPQVTPAP